MLGFRCFHKEVKNHQDFSTKPNFAIRLSLSIKPVLENRLSIQQLNSTLGSEMKKISGHVYSQHPLLHIINLMTLVKISGVLSYINLLCKTYGIKWIFAEKAKPCQSSQQDPFQFLSVSFKFSISFELILGIECVSV